MSPAGVSPFRNKERTILIRRISVLTLAYCAAGSLGLTFADYQENVTLVWPPTGLSLAALILYGLRLWPGVFLGSLLLNTTSGGLESAAAIGVAVGNTLEALTGAWLLVRVVEFRPSLERLRDVVAFLCIGAVGCTVVGATIGVTTLYLTGEIDTAEPWRVWLIWWLGDAGGAVILTPVLFAAARGTPPWETVIRSPEFWTVISLIACLSLWSVSGAVTGAWGFVAIFTPFPLVVWAGSRLGSRGAVLSLFLIMLIATLATARGVSPFVVEETHSSMMLLWTYGMTIGTTALALAATTGQRDRAEMRHRSEEAQRIRIQREQLLMQERARITREMHDGIGGQLVTTIAMLENGQADRVDLLESLRAALDDMRIVIDSLDPNATDFPTSLGKLRGRLEPLLRRNGVQLHWKVTDTPHLAGFSPEQSLNLLRIIQEAVTNAVRHARASEIEVSISVHDGPRGPLLIEIRDDGSESPRGTGTGGMGIRNMKTRATALGAEFVVEEGDPGTRIRLCVPVFV